MHLNKLKFYNFTALRNIKKGGLDKLLLMGNEKNKEKGLRLKNLLEIKNNFKGKIS